MYWSSTTPTRRRPIELVLLAQLRSTRPYNWPLSRRARFPLMPHKQMPNQRINFSALLSIHGGIFKNGHVPRNAYFLRFS